MAKKKEKTQFKVDFRPFNAKLKTTKKQLEEIRGKVTKKDRKVIAKQIKAINVLLGPCNPIVTTHPPMSARYTEK